MSDFAEAYADDLDRVLHSVDPEFRHRGVGGELGRTRLQPVDNYEGATCLD